MKIKEKLISINGIEQFYLLCGKGPALILLHGGLGTAQLNWGDYILELSENFTVYALDTRGHGRSTNPHDLFSYQQFSSDLSVFIKKLNLENPIVCGWSDGSQTALEHALNYPGEVTRYILGGVFIEQSARYYEGMRSLGLKENGEVDFDQLKIEMDSYYDLVKVAHSHQGENHWKKLVAKYPELYFTPMTYTESQLSTIMAKVLIVLGDRDQYISIEHAMKIFNAIDSSYLAIVPNTDHYLPMTRKDWFIREIINFSEI